MSSRVAPSTATLWLWPALLTSPPAAPSAASTSRTAACIDASSVTSSASVLQPFSWRSWIDSGLRAVAYTVQPFSARYSAVARPMPVEHPVIRTALAAFASSPAIFPSSRDNPHRSAYAPAAAEAVQIVAGPRSRPRGAVERARVRGGLQVGVQQARGPLVVRHQVAVA